MRMPSGVPEFNSPIDCQEWCFNVTQDRVSASPAVIEWAKAQLHAYRFGGWPGSDIKPKAKIAASVSRYGYNTTNSPAKHTHSAPSRRPVTLVKISPGKSDDWA